MMQHPTKRILLLVFVLLAQITFIHAEDAADDPVGPPPGTYKILYADSTIKIPFEIYRGDIRMRAQINGKSVHVLLDNGYLWDQLLFWGGPEVDSLGFTYEMEGTIGGVGDGDAIQADVATGVTISFPGVEFYDQEAIVMPSSSGASTKWSGSIGQVCGCFLKHFVVDINFTDGIITLIPPEKFVFADTGMAVDLIPNGDGSWTIPATVELEDGRIINRNLSLDLGYNNALEMSVGGEYNITLPANAIKTSLGFGLLGEILGHVGRVSSLTIGDYKLDNMLTSFVSEESAAVNMHDTWLGLDLMRRFNIIFDYPHQKMYFTPNRDFNEPFEYDMTGMKTIPTREGDWRIVSIVYPDSPASEIGLQVGDKVLSIDGKPAASYDIHELIPLFRREGKMVELEIERDSERFTKSLILRRLI
ncbi:MAG: PDZ domain-containing protein [Candidatus Zixiibacteriota bacterium]